LQCAWTDLVGRDQAVDGCLDEICFGRVEEDVERSIEYGRRYIGAGRFRCSDGRICTRDRSERGDPERLQVHAPRQMRHRSGPQGGLDPMRSNATMTHHWTKVSMRCVKGVPTCTHLGAREPTSSALAGTGRAFGTSPVRVHYAFTARSRFGSMMHF